MPGIFWTLTFPSCRSGIRTRNSNRAIRKKRPVRVFPEVTAVRSASPLRPDFASAVGQVRKVPLADIDRLRRRSTFTTNMREAVPIGKPRGPAVGNIKRPGSAILLEPFEDCRHPKAGVPR
jgi:hypothetical protein